VCRLSRKNKAHIVESIHLYARLNQQPYNLERILESARRMKDRGPILHQCSIVSLRVAQEEQTHLYTSMQVGAILNQQPNNLEGALASTRQMKGRPSILQSAQRGQLQGPSNEKSH
jgi:hypothetical protein